MTLACYGYTHEQTLFSGTRLRHKAINGLYQTCAQTLLPTNKWNTSAEIYADKGYVGTEREERLRDQGYRPQIQRKTKPGKPLSA